MLPLALAFKSPKTEIVRWSCGITIALRFQPAVWHQSLGFLAFVSWDHPSSSGWQSPAPSVHQITIESLLEGLGLTLTVLWFRLQGLWLQPIQLFVSVLIQSQAKPEEKRVEHTVTCPCGVPVWRAIVRAV